MANHEYPFVSEGAFFISRDVIPFLNLYCAKQTDMEIPEEIARIPAQELSERYYEEGYDSFFEDIVTEDWMDAISDLCYAQCFEGSVSTMFPKKAKNPIDESFASGDDTIAILECSREATLFRAAYTDLDELVAEYQERLSQLNLPESFDWIGHVVTVSGTTYC